MKKAASAQADVAIFGGGIAGLWLLHCLRQAGFSALLFESNALGGGQTGKSQGIIHGGMKYALQGMMTKDAQALAKVPEFWKSCLTGTGEIDLSHVPVLSPQHYLWSPTKFTAKLTGFLASSTLASKVETLHKDHYPAVFKHPDFKGEVYCLDEMVIDVNSLVRELVKYNQDAVFKIEPVGDEGLIVDEKGKLISATVYHAGKSVEVKAQQYVFVAGGGNEIIIKKLKNPDVSMQRRPLHMVLVKTPFQMPLYAHCLGLGTRPRITVTTHHIHDGSQVWYLGGHLAEEGVRLSSRDQIKATQKELNALFPWLDFREAEFATLMIDRAEPLQKNGFKPETSFKKEIQNITIAWPTKLALAPKLAHEIMDHFKLINLTPDVMDTRELRAWPLPPLSEAIWEDAFCKNVA